MEEKSILWFIEGIIHPKINIQSSSTHPYVTLVFCHINWYIYDIYDTRKNENKIHFYGYNWNKLHFTCTCFSILAELSCLYDVSLFQLHFFKKVKLLNLQ